MFNLYLVLLLLFVFFMISMIKIMTLTKDVRKIDRTLQHLIKKIKK